MNLNQVTANLNFIASAVHTLNVNCKMFKITDANKREFSLDIKHSKPTIGEDSKYGKLLMQINVSVMPENADLAPDTFELVMFRPDPPVDIDYIGATYIFDFVRTKVINSPFAIASKIISMLFSTAFLYQEISSEVLSSISFLNK